MSNTVGATVRPLSNDVPVTPMLMKPCFLCRHPPWPSGDPCSWYCHRAWTSGCQHGPAEALHGTGAGSPFGWAARPDAPAVPTVRTNATATAASSGASARRNITFHSRARERELARVLRRLFARSSGRNRLRHAHSARRPPSRTRELRHPAEPHHAQQVARREELVHRDRAGDGPQEPVDVLLALRDGAEQ